MARRLSAWVMIHLVECLERYLYHNSDILDCCLTRQFAGDIPLPGLPGVDHYKKSQEQERCPPAVQ